MTRLYVIIDESLDSVYGCVQGGHAVAAYMRKYSTKYWKNEYLIYLKANKETITMLKEHCERRNYRCVEWCEPDLDNKCTAIAIDNKGFEVPIKRMLQNLKLR